MVHLSERCSKCGHRHCRCKNVCEQKVIIDIPPIPGSCIRTDPNNGCSVAEGSNTVASGFASHAEGCNSIANGDCSHAEGRNTVANGNASHTEGEGTVTDKAARAAHAEGLLTKANNVASHAEGENTTANGQASHAEGNGTTTTINGAFSHAEGSETTTDGTAAHAEGAETIASDFAAHAEGFQTKAGFISHAEGRITIASGDVSHAEGSNTTASGSFSHAEGAGTTAGGIASHAEGAGTTASGDFSHSEGSNTTAGANFSHAEGGTTIASGLFAHAEGRLTNATSIASHAEGAFSTASGINSHAEGSATNATGVGSHSEGEGTTASGRASHAEGSNTIADGVASHAEGNATNATGSVCHTEGSGTTASGKFSHVEGVLTCDNGKTGVHVMGQLGGPANNDPNFSWYLVNGKVPCDPTGVVAKILNDGSACFDGKVTTAGIITAAGACDYAEMFETIDGQPIDVGYFVTFSTDGEKIRKANRGDKYILGITSSNPGLLADTEDPVCNKYLMDEWNRTIYEEITIPAVKDTEGNTIVEERTEMRKKINPAWNPDQLCSSRLEKPEWVAVGLIGKLLVRDDGTCRPGNHCLPNEQGIATAADNGYWVMKRTGPNQVLVLVAPGYKKAGISNAEQLEKLARLKEQGYLTAEEFNKQKQILLNS